MTFSSSFFYFDESERGLPFHGGSIMFSVFDFTHWADLAWRIQVDKLYWLFTRTGEHITVAGRHCTTTNQY